MPFLNKKNLKIKLRIFLADHTVAMVASFVTKMIPMSWPKLGRFFLIKVGWNIYIFKSYHRHLANLHILFNFEYLWSENTRVPEGFFFMAKLWLWAAKRSWSCQEKKTLWMRQLQTSLPCDFETKHLTKPVFAGSICFLIGMSARVATMRKTVQNKLSQDEEERNSQAEYYVFDWGQTIV